MTIRLRKVLGLEQFYIGHSFGSSHGHTRIFRIGDPNPNFIKLAVKAVDLLEELEEDCSKVCSYFFLLKLYFVENAS